MLKIKGFTYTKDSGEQSHRLAAIMSEPYPHYRMLDLSELSVEEVSLVRSVLEEIDDFRQARMDDLSDMLGQNVNYLWRSFKKEGIEWEQDD